MKKIIKVLSIIVVLCAILAFIGFVSNMGNIECRGVVVEIGYHTIFGDQICVESTCDYKNGHIYRLCADGYTVGEEVIMTINPGDRQGAQDDSVINIRHAD